MSKRRIDPLDHKREDGRIYADEFEPSEEEYESDLNDIWEYVKPTEKLTIVNIEELIRECYRRGYKRACVEYY